MECHATDLQPRSIQQRVSVSLELWGVRRNLVGPAVMASRKGFVVVDCKGLRQLDDEVYPARAYLAAADSGDRPFTPQSPQGMLGLQVVPEPISREDRILRPQR